MPLNEKGIADTTAGAMMDSWGKANQATRVDLPSAYAKKMACKLHHR